jgi:hypothetical protein
MLSVFYTGVQLLLHCSIMTLNSECCYAECRSCWMSHFFIVILSVFILNVVASLCFELESNCLVKLLK